MRYSWKTILNHILKHKKILYIGNFMAILSISISVPTPLFMPILIDEIILHKEGFFKEFVGSIIANPDIYTYLMIVFFAVVFFRGLSLILNVFQAKIYSLISKDLIFDMRKSILRHIEKISMKEYESLPSGDISSKMISDLNTIDEFISKSISKLVSSVLTIIGVCSILIWINPILAMIIILLNPIVIIISSFLSKKVALLKKKENNAISVFSESIGETIELFSQLKSSNKEKSYFSTLIDKANDIKFFATNFGYKGDAHRQVSFFIFLFGIEFFRAVIVLYVFQDELSVGLMIAVFAYLWFMISPVEELIGIQYTFNSASASLKRINTIFDLKQEPIYPRIHNPFKENTISITLKNVSFSYQENSIFKNLNLEISPKDKISIIGASGSGKTTLARLLVGFYEIDSGDILFNGISYKEIGLDVIRDSVFLVLQSSVMFNDSVRTNLTLGSDFSDDEIYDALKMAKMFDKVSKMPEKLDTMLGKNGIRLSGGQGQRMSIARMILKNPKIIILDESTSALDLETEDLLYNSLKDFFKDKTIITIAHRLSTIEKSNKIYEIQNHHLKQV